MKYLYQQLLAFGGLILLIIVIVGTSFTQMTKKTMQDANYDQLFRYAEAALKAKDSFSPALFTETERVNLAFQFTENTFETQNLQFVYLDTNMNRIFPEQLEKPLEIKISDAELERMAKGETVYKTIDKDIYGNKNATSYVITPVTYSYGGNEQSNLAGYLMVTQPAKNVTDSVNEVTSNLSKGFIISSVVAVIVSYGFAAFQVQRINRMRKATREITNGNFDIKLPVHDKDEFDDLAEDFNKMAESLAYSQEEIERQEERRRQFMADASHEMRTPLTTINGLLEGLEYNAIPEDQKENAIKLMQNETARLIRLVNENLDYEKIRTDQISIVVKKFNATETLKNILTQLQGKAEAAGDTLYLDTEESVDVYADYDRFTQVIVNIVQNAIQFTTDGEIHVSLEKGYLETIVKISDTGIGMTEEQLKNIWDRYYKADPSRKNTKYGESGLGLPIVQQLVRLHKGKIAVESEIGKGTTFTVTFPDIEVEKA
ncbi:HAMP domain-containing histidine kinase [Enterococcus sp. BWB1-3]|uniref:sensor histidine kinase n=1 Tax=Enterococcus sp. BWB1-3 TaxID=2787713 RepID=UPI00192245FD|nr:HAMP domain-containing sensor histidine kinase [Enterococcus sp. BWB1-3]MBL1230467.1 HAMP domain-containing histidine kinase [Enterococcus sp. BWB1-3]